MWFCHVVCQVVLLSFVEFCQVVFFRWFFHLVLSCGSAGGFVSWFCQVVLSGGFVRWFLQVVSAGGFVRWFCQVVLSGGSDRWFCQVGWVVVFLVVVGWWVGER